MNDTDVAIMWITQNIIWMGMWLVTLSRIGVL
jgi:hypothetical protein